jgi:NAD dependent epimerase/dehydratase
MYNLLNKTVLVTGADGFIGSHLVERLIEEGCLVKAFVYYNSFNSWGWLDELTKEQKSKIEIIVGDIRDPNGVKQAMKNVEIVFHLAALISIPFSYNSPDSYIDTNIKGTLNVLQSAKDLGIRKTLVTSTSEVYGTAQFVPITETHPKQPQSPYSASKIGADSLAESFYRSFDLPVVIVRPFNTYGPRQSARAIIPTVITQLLNRNKELKLGDLKPTRDLVYVKDTVDAFVKIALCDTLVGQEVNIATSSEISIGELVAEIAKILNIEVNINTDTDRIRPTKSEVFRLLGSNLKLLEHTNWKQNYNIQKGLLDTINWFKEPKNLIRYKSEIYNI